MITSSIELNILHFTKIECIQDNHVVQVPLQAISKKHQQMKVYSPSDRTYSGDINSAESELR